MNNLQSEYWKQASGLSPGIPRMFYAYMRMFEFFNGVMLHENGNATRFGRMQCNMILHARMRNARLERTLSRGKEFCWGNDHNLLSPGNVVGDT